MEVAITGVKHIGHHKAMIRAEAIDGSQNGWEGRSRNDAILQVVAGALTPQSRDRTFSAPPEPRPFGLIPSLPNPSRSRFAAKASGQLHCLLHFKGLAIQLNQENSSSVRGVFLLGEGSIDSFDAGVVHDLQTGRQYSS